MRKIFHIYKATNLLTGKVYIGMTSRSVRYRWSQHVMLSKKPRQRTAISAAIAAYGRPAFQVEIICDVEGFEGAAQRERELIQEYGCIVPHGYNLTSGGEKISGFNLSSETKRKMSDWQIGKIVSEETRRKIGLGNTGKVFTSEHRQKLSIASSSRPRSEAFKEKLRLARKGKPRPSKGGRWGEVTSSIVAPMDEIVQYRA